MADHNRLKRVGSSLGHFRVTHVPPWIGAAEFVANFSPGGAPPPVPDHLLQEDGFDLLQEDGSLILL